VSSRTARATQRNPVSKKGRQKDRKEGGREQGKKEGGREQGKKEGGREGRKLLSVSPSKPVYRVRP
jgi:hypothetical protein